MPKTIFWWIAVGWTLVIAVLCLVSFNIFPDTREVKNGDKYVHVTFHFLFVTFWFLNFKDREGKALLILLRIFLASVIYGIAIELAQEFFTTTRQADLKDVIANTIGAFLAVLVLSMLKKPDRKRQAS